MSQLISKKLEDGLEQTGNLKITNREKKLKKNFYSYRQMMSQKIIMDLNTLALDLQDRICHQAQAK
jgi:hypothetical protein